MWDHVKGLAQVQVDDITYCVVSWNSWASLDIQRLVARGNRSCISSWVDLWMKMDLSLFSSFSSPFCGLWYSFYFLSVLHTLGCVWSRSPMWWEKQKEKLHWILFTPSVVSFILLEKKKKTSHIQKQWKVISLLCLVCKPFGLVIFLCIGGRRSLLKFLTSNSEPEKLLFLEGAKNTWQKIAFFSPPLLLCNVNGCLMEERQYHPDPHASKCFWEVLGF